MTFYRNEIKKKSESRRRTKKTYILHLEYSWIREFVKIGIFYTKKTSECFSTDTNTKRMYWKKSKKYSAKKKNKKKSNV